MNIRHTSRHKWFVASPNSRRVLVFLVLLGLLLAGCKKSSVTTGLEALQAAYEGHRPLEARISGQAYAPFLSRRGGSDDSDPLKRDLAERLLREAVAENPTSSARQALGQFHLMSGSPAEAIVQFEEALKSDANDASLRNDYGVALMASGQKSLASDSGNTLLFFAKALEQFEAALKISPASVESLHNRALLLEQLKLPQQRDKAWQAYLAHETEQHWTAEAKRRLQTISLTDSKLLTRAQMLESFLAATLAGDDERIWRE